MLVAIVKRGKLWYFNYYGVVISRFLTEGNNPIWQKRVKVKTNHVQTIVCLLKRNLSQSASV